MWTILMATLIAVCGHQQDIASPEKKAGEPQRFTLSGTVEGSYSGFIYLNYGEHQQRCRIEDGRFEFAGAVDRPTPAHLTLEPPSSVGWIYLEAGDIRLQATSSLQRREGSPEDGNAVNVITIKKVEGSKTAAIQERYQNFYQTHKAKENFQELLFEELGKMIRDDPQHPFFGRVLGELALIEPVLDYRQVAGLSRILDHDRQFESDLEMIRIGLDKLHKYGVGKPFPDLQWPDRQGEEVKVSDFRGKVLLIDVWASWCKPCRKKHPELIRFYNRYRNRNFEILGVSIDDDPAAWTEAVGQDKLPWRNARDAREQARTELELGAVPASFLIDGDGTVLGRNLRLEQIKKILDSKGAEGAGGGDDARPGRG